MYDALTISTLSVEREKNIALNIDNKRNKVFTFFCISAPLHSPGRSTF